MKFNIYIWVIMEIKYSYVERYYIEIETHLGDILFSSPVLGSQ